jgi:hypothetical protein
MLNIDTYICHICLKIATKYCGKTNFRMQRILQEYQSKEMTGLGYPCVHWKDKLYKSVVNSEIGT